MDENEAISEQEAATPIFSVYRRGYDPDQVDRYVADQQRRLDDAVDRASESERRLAAAVGQLRELHRRVAAYESETRSVQPPALDTLGERVQRILQEAWEGAYTLRQEAEREVNELREGTSEEVAELRAAVAEEVSELREVASREGAEVVDQATRRALAIRDETERRRVAYLQRIDQDRERAVSQLTYLFDQRQEALADLARLQATLGATVEEMARSPLGRPAPGVAAAASPSTLDGSMPLPDERAAAPYGDDSAATGAGRDQTRLGAVPRADERALLPDASATDPQLADPRLPAPAGDELPGAAGDGAPDGDAGLDAPLPRARGRHSGRGLGGDGALLPPGRSMGSPGGTPRAPDEPSEPPERVQEPHSEWDTPTAEQPAAVGQITGVLYDEERTEDASPEISTEFVSGTPVVESEPPVAPPRRTGLFDAEAEGWT